MLIVGNVPIITDIHKLIPFSDSSVNCVVYSTLNDNINSECIFH